MSDLSPIVGEDKAFRRVIEVAKKAALTDSPVLITGETGTGKDLIAKQIHKPDLL